MSATYINTELFFKSLSMRDLSVAVSSSESVLPYQNTPAWWNGHACLTKDLWVSIMDLGLIHSDATYDVIAVRNNRPWAIEEHLDRFFSSCRAWRLSMPYPRQQIQQAVMDVHARTGWQDSIIWISVTRGVPHSGNPRDLISPRANVMIYAKPWQKFNGTNRATVMGSNNAVRVPNCSIDQNNKNFVWSDLTIAQWEAIDCGFDTAVVFGMDGFLSEGPGFNVAIVKDRKILAPGKNRLPGISMTKVKEICHAHDREFEWADLTRAQVNDCDDMFLTTTVGNIVTVTNYNGRNLIMSDAQRFLIEFFENLGKENK